MKVLRPWQLGLAACVVAAFCGLVVPEATTNMVAPGGANALPSAAAWLGCDPLGRPVLARLARASFTLVGPAAGAALSCGLLGVVLGVLAGWTAGPLGALARALAGSVAALPRLVLALLVVLAWGPTPLAFALCTGVAYAPSLAQALASRIESLGRADFVVAARGHGIPEGRILGYHLLWVDCGPTILRGMGAAAGGVVLLDATLAYLGALGIAEPTPTFGNMLALAIAWGSPNPAAWLAPGLAIVVAAAGSGWTAPREAA